MRQTSVCIPCGYLLGEMKNLHGKSRRYHAGCIAIGKAPDPHGLRPRRGRPRLPAAPATPGAVHHPAARRLPVQRSPNECYRMIEVQAHNTDLKNRLSAFAAKYPQCCRQIDDVEQGGLTFEIEKGRLSFRLTAPYSEERKQAASERAKKNGIKG